MASRSDKRILVVDDHVEMGRLLADQLTDSGFVVEVAAGGEQALALVRSRPFDVVITDLRMEDVDGFDVLEGVKAVAPEIPVLIMTAFGAIDSAVEAIQRGAFHYLTKPFKLEEVLVYVEKALGEQRLRDENRALRMAALEAIGPHQMVGTSPKMRALMDLIDRVAPAQAPVLIRGESGTGKELVARALHERSPRKDRAFVAVNCTALPEALLESELFGHVRGAYTGASTARRGLFVEADGGTLLLDEIGDMPTALQAKLLRVLEDGEIRAVGSDVARRVDVRVVAATHQNLEDRVHEGKFREDLFYRLNVVPLQIPPLRERPEDIEPLTAHFLGRARARNRSARVERFSPEVISALSRMDWPGNVRELENFVERLVIVVPSEVVELQDVQNLGGTPASIAPTHPSRRNGIQPLRKVENEYIAWAIKECGGNKTRAAELLGIDVSTIHRRERERALQ